MPQPREHTCPPYLVDTFDILEFLEQLPLARGTTTYAISHREAFYAFAQWLLHLKPDTTSKYAQDSCHVYLSTVLDWLKGNSLVAIHQRSTQQAQHAQEAEQARVDAYSLLYDHIWRNF